MLRKFLGGILVVVVVLVGTESRVLAQQAGATDAGAASPLTIRVLDDDWNAPRSNLQALLESTARQIHRHFDGLDWPAIEVYRSQPWPITIHQRGAEGQVRIGLTPQGMYWAQYAFQFGHELGHLIAGHLQTDRQHSNSWFEEAVCECASLFVLRSMHDDWETNPPYANWKDWRKHLWNYAQTRMDAPEHNLPEGQDFPAWYKANEENLMNRDSHQGARTVIVARQLLPVFEEDPAGWQAVAYLRSGDANPHGPLEKLLPAWHDACPEALRGFVVSLAETLGVAIPSGEPAGVSQ